MKRFGGYLRLMILLPLIIPANVFGLASAKSGVVITEIQTTGANNVTNEEFVELYNSSESTIDISSWKMQYLSAAGTTWQTKATLNGFFYPHGRILIAANNFMVDQADVSYSPGLKLEAGHLRIVSTDPEDNTQLVVQDLVGWGAALYPEGKASPFAPAGSSLQRKVSGAGQYVDTDDNSADFEVSATPTPESLNVAPEVPEETPVESPTTTVPADIPENSLPEPENTTPAVEPTVDVGVPDPSESVIDPLLMPIQITELLPNPAAPASDSTDEYIELYNPNDTSVNLGNYKLQSGNAYTYSYTITDQVLEPHTYLALYVRDTGLILSNSSGRARLINPSGVVTFETDPYENAKEGQAWVYVDQLWQWSLVPTAGAVNVVAEPAVEQPVVLATPATSSSTRKATKKPTKAKKTSTPKKATAKKSTAKQKTAKPKSAVAGTSDSTTPSNEPVSSSPLVHKLVIAAVGLIALGYAIYEYKDDISNKILQFRRNRKLGKSAGAPT